MWLIALSMNITNQHAASELRNPCIRERSKFMDSGVVGLVQLGEGGQRFECKQIEGGKISVQAN